MSEKNHREISKYFEKDENINSILKVMEYTKRKSDINVLKYFVIDRSISLTRKTLCVCKIN